MPLQPQEHDHLLDLLSMVSIENRFFEICLEHKCYQGLYLLAYVIILILFVLALKHLHIQITKLWILQALFFQYQLA